MNRLLLLMAWIVAWGAAPALAEEGVPHARDLRQEALLARANNAALLVVFVNKPCSYCDTVLNEFLLPLSRNPDYQRKVVMRRIETSSQRDLMDFTGRKTTHRAFARLHGVQMVPTVMLFDETGHALAKPLVGITTVDYYGLYLDEVIDTALARLRGEAQPAAGS
jgi:thioredoxin-related protein